MNKKDSIIFAIIFIEGFTVLASEVLIMRRLIPYVGNSVDITSIIIGLVLLPLSIGYFFGGKYQQNNNNIRKKICKNFTLIGIWLAIGFSFFTLELCFGIFQYLHIYRIVQVFIYMVIFFVYPIFLLAQTIPLISNYFTKQDFTSLTGKILYSSTFGSLLGSIITTLILMNFFGVSYSVLVVLLSVLLVSLILNKKLLDYNNFIILTFFIIYFITDIKYKEEHKIYSDKLYSTIQINLDDNAKSKLLKVNNSNSAKISNDPEKRYEYIKYIEDTIIDIESKHKQKKEILVIGAGGFTIGHNDQFNNYYYVDIDKELKPISEKFFLEKPLLKNHKFFHSSARSFLNNTKRNYDIIIIDVYSNESVLPFQLLTIEFFKQIKSLLKDNAIAVLNIIANPNYSDNYSIRIDNTLRTVFPNITRQIVGNYSFQTPRRTNLLYIYNHINYNSKIYTDDLNSSYLDMPSS